MFDSIGPWILLSSLVIAGATFWNAARKTAVDMLAQQVNILREDIKRLTSHAEECERNLRELRGTNQWLTEQIQKAQEHNGRRWWIR